MDRMEVVSKHLPTSIPNESGKRSGEAEFNIFHFTVTVQVCYTMESMQTSIYASKNGSTISGSAKCKHSKP